MAASLQLQGETLKEQRHNQAEPATHRPALPYWPSLPNALLCYCEHSIFDEFMCNFICFSFHFKLFSSILFLTCFSAFCYMVMVDTMKFFHIQRKKWTSVACTTIWQMSLEAVSPVNFLIFSKGTQKIRSSCLNLTSSENLSTIGTFMVPATVQNDALDLQLAGIENTFSVVYTITIAGQSPPLLTISPGAHTRTERAITCHNRAIKPTQGFKIVVKNQSAVQESQTEDKSNILETSANMASECTSNFTAQPSPSDQLTSCNDEEDFLEVNFYLIALYGLIFLVCFPGNIAAIFVYCVKMRPWRSSTIIMLNLAITDLLYVVTLPFFIHYYANGNDWIFGDFMCKVIQFCFYFNMYSGIIFLSCFSIFRFLVVVHPMKSLFLRKRRWAVVTCTVVWIISLVALSPLAILIVPSQRQNKTICPDLVAAEDSITSRWYNWGLTVVAFFLPLLTVTLCYVLIICILATGLHTQAGYKQKARRLTVLLLLVFYSFWLKCLQAEAQQEACHCRQGQPQDMEGDSPQSRILHTQPSSCAEISSGITSGQHFLLTPMMIHEGQVLSPLGGLYPPQWQEKGKSRLFLSSLVSTRSLEVLGKSMRLNRFERTSAKIGCPHWSININVPAGLPTFATYTMDTRLLPLPVLLMLLLLGVLEALQEQVLGIFIQLHIQEVQLLYPLPHILADVHIRGPRNVELGERGNEF
ncbi:hypothetical protein DV515_00003882 [Chloebia gouldiae]|uniref:G-protein coupled receptors family 1 profile domain-containing protein n=1 Tax=Chloebia gouldiae TaxID=44316 RepID=A0A3L8SVU4_CHLGU|nr:hypothetical protein DV515_00003882 [Chloebia gouldiae]